MCMSKRSFLAKHYYFFSRNFIPNKIILCDDKDPPWMNDEIKKLIKKKNWLFQCQRKPGNLDYASLNFIIQDISNVVNSSKLKYHECLALKLNDHKTVPNSYREILKTFFNGTKVLSVSPLLVENQLVTDFLVKANLFSDYLSQHCTTVDNNISFPPNIMFATEQKLWNSYQSAKSTSLLWNSLQMILSILLNRWIQTRPMDTMKYLFE